jgi:DNA gyrase subunit A
VSEIRELGRATQGVTLMALDDGAQLSGLQRIVENDAAGSNEPSAGEVGGLDVGSDTDNSSTADEQE